MGYGITIFITSSISLFIKVKKHIYFDLSKSNIVIFLLLSIFTFIVLRFFTNNFLNNLFIIKNLTVITITMFIFIILSFFGIESE